MSLPPAQAPNDTEIAAEYVLRVLPADAHRTAAVRAANDPAFAAEVRAWEDRFAPLMEEVAPIAPPDEIKSILIDQLFGLETDIDEGPRTVIWQALTALGFATAAALAVISFVPQEPAITATGPRFVAELATAGDATRLLAVYAPETGALNITWTARDQPANRDFELWGTIDGSDPISIGVLERRRTATVDIPPELLDNTNKLTLTISQERRGGSTTGAPSDDIVASTAVSNL